MDSPSIFPGKPSRWRFLITGLGAGMLLAAGLWASRSLAPANVSDELFASTETPPGAGARPVEIVEKGNGYRVIHHAGGTTRVPANPQRICALAAADELLSLGVTPVAHSIHDGNFPDYLAEALQDVPWIPNVYGAHMPNMEAIVRVRPDLIITRTPSRQTYEQLSRIAPTVVLLDHLEHYRQRVLDVGTIIGKRRESEARLAWYNAKAAAAREVIRQTIGSQSMALIRVRPKSYRLYGDQHHVSPVLYGDLGIQRPRLLAERSWSSTMSPEGLLHLDADYLIIAIDPATGSRRTWDDLLTHPIWRRVPAVRNGNIHLIDKYRHWADAGILGRGRAIDDVIRAISPESLDEVNAKAQAALRKDRA